jgi:hypothetical protein
VQNSTDALVPYPQDVFTNGQVEKRKTVAKSAAMVKKLSFTSLRSGN